MVTFMVWFGYKVDIKIESMYLHPTLVFLSSFIVFFLILGHRLREESKVLSRMKMDEVKLNDLLILITVKNAKMTLERNLRNLLDSVKARILVYDDGSEDGTFEMVKELSRRNENLKVRRLKKDGRFLHPKGFAFEKAVKEEKFEWILVLDHETNVKGEDLRKAISFMNEKKVDVFHFVRRNRVEGSFISRITDGDELVSDGLLMMNFPVFKGSGFIVRRKIAEKVEYPAICHSEDTKLLEIFKKLNARVYQSGTLQVHELPPMNFLELLKQRYRWLRGSIMQSHLDGTSSFVLQNVLSAMILNFLISPFRLNILNQIGLDLILTVMSFSLVMNVLVGRKNMLDAFIDSFLTTAFLIFEYAFLYPYTLLRCGKNYKFEYTLYNGSKTEDERNNHQSD